MATTQQHLPIKDIKDNLVLLKDGSYVAILKTSAVNFDLLSENEQLAIISSFAGLLNSLSFAIQIIIRSKRLDISNYINLLVQAQSQQTNPLLKQIMEKYKIFIETIIRENEVLDKQFYVVVSISSLELGISSDEQKKLDKAQTLILPRVDHLTRQLSRAGLSAEILSSEKLIKLFYDIYNEQIPVPDSQLEKAPDQEANQPDSVPSTQTPSQPPELPIQPPIQPQTVPAPNPPSAPQIPLQPPPVQALAPQPNIPPTPPKPVTPPSITQPNVPTINTQTPKPESTPKNYPPPSSHAPYVVEELHDDYSSV